MKPNMNKTSRWGSLLLLLATTPLFGRVTGSDNSIYNLQNSYIRSDDHGAIVHRNKILFLGDENQQHDFNNDGDRNDVVCFIHDQFDPFNHVTYNLQWVTDGGVGFKVQKNGPWAALPVFEDHHVYLNNDNDKNDYVHHLVNVNSKEVVNLRWAGYENAFVGDYYFFNVDESQHGGSDRNSDRDSNDKVLHYYDIETQEIHNLAIAADYLVGYEEGLYFAVPEEQEQQDLNGDDDQEDLVLHRYNIVSGSLENFGIAVMDTMVVNQEGLSFRVYERGQGQADLNADSDTWDEVAHFLPHRSSQVINLGLACYTGSHRLQAEYDLTLITVSEREQGLTDLNNDGDTDDRVLHAYDATNNHLINLPHAVGNPKAYFAKNKIVFAVSEHLQDDKDLNGDADSHDQVIYVWDKITGRITNTQMAAKFSDQREDNHLYVLADEFSQGQQDLNGDGDANDHIIHYLDLKSLTYSNMHFALPEDGRFQVQDGVIYGALSEFHHGNQDLNFDGTTDDDLLFMHHIALNQTWISIFPVNPYLTVKGKILAANLLEDSRFHYNHDADSSDPVMHSMDVTPFADR